jgi:hypothetical protein
MARLRMGHQTIPEQQHSLAAEVASQFLQEADQANIVVGARVGLEVRPCPLTVPPVAERRRGRSLWAIIFSACPLLSPQSCRPRL